MTWHRPRPTSGTARVTVVIPCYNYGHYLSACVASALSQQGVEVDVIIVDDASPDGSVEVAYRIAAADSRVSVRAHPVNTGHIRTYNDGLAEATGEFVVLLSADDLLTDGSLARSVALMQAFPEVGLVYGNPLEFTDERPRARSSVTSWSVWTGSDWARRMCARGHNMIFTPEAVMRTSVMKDLVGYDETLPHSADMLLWLRAACRTSVGRVNGVDQAYYRVHGANMHIQDFGDPLADITERSRAFEAFFAGDGQTLPGWTKDRALARRSLARDALRTGRHVLDSGDGQIEIFREAVALAGTLDRRPAHQLTSLLDRSRQRRLAARRPPSWPQRGTIAVRDLEWKLRWRRWYWLGT